MGGWWLEKLFEVSQSEQLVQRWQKMMLSLMKKMQSSNWGKFWQVIRETIKRLIAGVKSHLGYICFPDPVFQLALLHLSEKTVWLSEKYIERNRVWFQNRHKTNTWKEYWKNRSQVLGHKIIHLSCKLLQSLPN